MVEQTNQAAQRLKLHEFSEILFRDIPQSFGLLKYEAYYQKFQNYQQSIPVYGAILLNGSLTKVLLVTNMNKKYYNFPKGKVNEGEEGIKCAIREVWEEIGMDVRSLIQENCSIEYSCKKEFKMMYVVVGVNESFQFNPNHNTRNEIGSVTWMQMSDFDRRKEEDKFSLIKHFYQPLKLFIERYKRVSKRNTEAKQVGDLTASPNPHVKEKLKMSEGINIRIEDLLNTSGQPEENEEDAMNELDEQVDPKHKETHSQGDDLIDPVSPKLSAKASSLHLGLNTDLHFNNIKKVLSQDDGLLESPVYQKPVDKIQTIMERFEHRIHVFGEEIERKLIERVAGLKDAVENPNSYQEDGPAPNTLINPFKDPAGYFDD